MKTKLLFLAFIFSSCFLFPQTNNIKSSWVGGGFNFYHTGAVAGDEFYIVGSEFEQIQIGDQITKIKFFHYLGTMSFTSGNVTFDNSQYTIKIYENPPLAGPYAGYGYYDTDIGTPVYTQTITLGTTENDQIYEMTLSTPYTVNENEFWVAVCFDNGKGAMRIGELDELSEGKYYMYWDGDAIMPGVGTVIGKANFTDSYTEPKYHPLGISIFVDDGNPYAEQSDLTIKYLDTYPNPDVYITHKIINETENLIIYPAIINNGVDATSNIASVSATINGESYIENLEVDLSGTNSLSSGSYKTIYDGGAFLITASEMNNLELSGLFDICFTVTYAGSDPVSANNTTCLTVTRGEIAATTCDLEALFVTSNTDLTSIPANITIGLTDDITLLPAVTNNGPDPANNYAEIKITAFGFILDDYSKNLTGFSNGETILLNEEATTLTADAMDLIGEDSFDICLTVTYAGTDNITGNNTFCVTVTREDPTKIDSNITTAILVYPNPANNVITVANAENENIVVLNMLGEVVANISNATSNQTIDISNLSNGTYFVRVNSEVVKINVIK